MHFILYFKYRIEETKRAFECSNSIVSKIWIRRKKKKLFGSTPLKIHFVCMFGVHVLQQAKTQVCLRSRHSIARNEYLFNFACSQEIILFARNAFVCCCCCCCFFCFFVRHILHSFVCLHVCTSFLVHCTDNTL